MRFYTALINKQPEVLVCFEQGGAAYRLPLLARLAPELAFIDMNALILGYNDKVKATLARLATNADTLQGAAVAVDEVQLLAPIVRPLQDVVCLGINYDAHAQEAGRFSDEAFGGERPYTIYFSKRVNRATATGEKVPAYAGLVDSLDYEAELGVVLGRDAKGVTKEEARDYVFGYTIINDISARNLQTRHKQWYLGKSLDGFTPMGPCIVTADEIGDEQSLDISSRVNCELRQSSNTRYMIQTVAGAIAELSQGMTLEAGTIIATGTPAGVGMGMTPPTFLKHGDKVVCEIEKIGRLENEID
ncbi:fumarylacetoacetate hydrolase family protein [uncultured Phascolarctobacterium sp.]|mgnify:FL=1|jgi:2-keto-4-pentenoate hydratase/2-oxohepta-3-ene-1,7-dioic acid hydratase in catechol pathway|uniref:fumarylacetoacetate hydrolase family protein n=1 Tax=uncultured Phascolarctobacterium sp. TaxID=512296 RepID=UPI0025F71009|nr:fumarylacetoacetate hydrolase family protein [uncultured Phascolarctobacterium sp.]